MEDLNNITVYTNAAYRKGQNEMYEEVLRLLDAEKERSGLGFVQYKRIREVLAVLEKTISTSINNL